MRKITLLCLFFLMTASVFAKKPIAPTSGLQGTWTIVTQLDAKGNMDDIKVGSMVSFDLKSNRITANMGCNDLLGNWVETKKQTVKKIMMAGTKKACEAEIMQAEAQFAKNIGKVNAYKLNSGMLELYKGKKLIMVLKRG